ncbi:ABC transporter permease [Streptomyces sp. PLK6-54]|uniref:ABC transporter permease n=1 Tax=Actinacidiphila acidipaludis TaxID=2873382 RepID=A0ABS7Q3H0_9ACTN|nr:ABC transporter permease [Streptomyces acidipaludis]
MARGVLIALLVAVCGVVLGLLWLWLAPRIPMVSDGQAVYLKDTEGEEAIGADGWFALLAAVLGVVTAALVFWRFRRGGVAVVLGLAVGGVAASVIGWRVGVWLGPPTDIVAHAKAVGPKKVFDGPLELRAKSALVAWPAAAMLVHLCLTSAFGPRDPEPVPPPAAGPWGPPPPPPPVAH